MPAKKLPEAERLERQRIGATIRAIRTSKGLTVDDVANRVSATVPLSRPFLANIEAGRRGLPRDLCGPLAAALDCDPGALVRADYYSEDDDDAPFRDGVAA